MKNQAEVSIGPAASRSPYWMRYISFVALHRLLIAASRLSNERMTAGDLNELARRDEILHTQKGSTPARATLYHYRNSLLQLGALRREGRFLFVNHEESSVRSLLSEQMPARNVTSLSDSAREHFAALVLKNEQCRSLFFDLFMPANMPYESLAEFQRHSLPITWVRTKTGGKTEVLFRNQQTGRSGHCRSHVSVASILYGVRYWARNELQLIDEYCQRNGETTVMFPICQASTTSEGFGLAVRQMLNVILSTRPEDKEWVVLSVTDLITRLCEAQRQPIRVLFGAIDWLVREWPRHVFLIPTSRALATLAASSSVRDDLELRRYYKRKNSPYISHVRIHKDVQVEAKGGTI